MRKTALAYAANLNALPFEAYLQKLVESPERASRPRHAPKARKRALSAERQKLLALRLKQKSGERPHE